ncbi:hypothetical protein [Candidatus Darwinibacter acetoxidans]
MAGYDYNAWKSNNAITAEDEGLVTASKISRAWLEENGIDEQVGFIKWMIRIQMIGPSEWHHTSKFYNRTYFYDAEDIADKIESLGEKSMGVLRDIYADRDWRKASEGEIKREALRRLHLLRETRKSNDA